MSPAVDALSEQDSIWWQHPLVRELAVVLAIKIALLIGLWWAFFDLPDNQHITTADVGTHMAGPVAPERKSREETLQ